MKSNYDVGNVGMVNEMTKSWLKRASAAMVAVAY